MARRADAAEPAVLLVDKPAGLTSHDVVSRVRRLAGTRRVGHAGTLDPMATGVLVRGVGRATRRLTFLDGCDKASAAGWPVTMTWAPSANSGRTFRVMASQLLSI